LTTLLYGLDPKLGYDVAYFNFAMLKICLSWFRNVNPIDENIINNLNGGSIIYSGGSLLCDRLGIPIVSKLNKSIYLMTCLSSSTDKKVALGFYKNCLYEITVPKRLIKYLMPVSECSSCQIEYEIVLPIGSSLKVTTVTPTYNEESKRTHYTISMTLEEYDIDAMEKLVEFFRLTTKTNTNTNANAVIQQGGSKSRKHNICGFFTELDMASLKTIIDIGKTPKEKEFNKVQDIGNYLCARLRKKCNDQQYTNKAKNIVNCISENCDILPYVRYNLDIPHTKYIDSDIGYINVGDINDMKNENLAYITFGKKVIERYNLKETDLVNLDNKMEQFFHSDNVFKMNKYIHWKLYELYHRTTDEFTKSIIATVKQNIRYK